ncbi:calcineurin-like phosphoesterase C-terminal domain-containing protein [Marinilabilia salmonicolor]|uniref:calcineurin-like phosphoesterase C-terminal domain-containing protein n=1 Tax=Marinilabilia salmonicolor TaxID=989 RepID=UPI00029AAC4B|nr:calcineurin-like phosphoesterase family protein [Marinilabilia salmonicolor]
MKTLIIFLFLFSFGVFTINAQNQATGFVYEDINQNGKKEKGESGIPNVAVSNGREVVLTDSDGKYKLPVGADHPIFVIKPSGYSLPVDEHNLPQFFHIHKPAGSPKLDYSGVAPTGDLPRSVDFGLFPGAENMDFTMLVFGDPQPYTRKEVKYFYKGIVKELEGVENVDFGLSLGDLVGDDLDLFQPYRNAVKKIGVPWFNVMGNHDMNFDVEADSLSDETFEKHFGPANYSFNHGKVHFIVLDDILYPDPRDGKGYWGGFREDQLAFVKNDLQYVPKDHLIVLAFHIPLKEGEFGDTFRDSDREKLFHLLKDYPHTLSLSAHTHIQNQDFFDSKDGWQQDCRHHEYNVGTTSGDWYGGHFNEQGVPVSMMRDGTPKGYAFLSFEGNQYFTKYKVAGEPEDYQLSLYAPKVVPQNEWLSAPLVVNFFMGSEKDSVFYRIDQGEWKPMNFVRTYDPAYIHTMQEWDYADSLLPGKRPSNPAESTHIWLGRINNHLEEGLHIIEVKATDMFGQECRARKEYRIVNRK